MDLLLTAVGLLCSLSLRKMSLPQKIGCVMVMSAYLGGEEGCHIPADGFARGWMCLAAAEEEEVMSCTMAGLDHLRRIRVIE